MNPEIKAKWLEAIPKYKKGVGLLKNTTDNSYCCLGVLLDIVRPDLWVGGSNKNECKWEKFPACGRNVPHPAYLSLEVLDQCGLTVYEQSTLAEINDASDSWEPVLRYIENEL